VFKLPVESEPLSVALVAAMPLAERVAAAGAPALVVKVRSLPAPVPKVFKPAAR
jgi:hypothetical protein